MSAAIDHAARAREAAKLSRSGLTGRDLGMRLGISVREASTLAGVGNKLRDIAERKLTASEILLLRSVAVCERRKLDHLDLGSITTFAVACAAGKGNGWPGSVSAKRLRSGTEWCSETRSHRPVGLGLIDFSGNGYIRLTSLGWTVVQALEAAVHG